MSIDLAWKSLSFIEQMRVIDMIRDAYITPHVERCNSCEISSYGEAMVVTTPCGTIQHMTDLIEAMGDGIDAN